MTMTIRQFAEAPGCEDWRVVGDGAHAFYRTDSLAASAQFVSAIGSVVGIEDHPPDLDVRADGVTVRLLTATDAWYGMTERDVDLAGAISGVARELGLSADPSRIQSFLVIVESLAPASVMPFWRAALGYHPRPDSPEEDLVDPRDRGPGLWFETLEQDHDGRAGIHIAAWVPAEEAEARVAAALAAGGRVVRDETAPSWWTLSDAAGNEVDIATTVGRG